MNESTDIKPTIYGEGMDFSESAILKVKAFDFYYGSNQALYNINMDIPENQVVALIGPSGCGKSTLLRNFNRMNEMIDGTFHHGDIQLHGESIYDENRQVIELRKQVGMVFQKSNPFPKSIFENVVFSLRIAGENNRKKLEEICERSLKEAALWDEVKDRLSESAFGLSGGQMQRLCIARAIANRPEIILMDEPCSALDPISTDKIDQLIVELKKDYTIIIVTHNLQQAGRIADYTGFFYLGELVEYTKTKQIFVNPIEERTQNYVSGRVG